MYSFAQREDAAVFDEPLFGYFLQKTGVWRPSREEVLATMELDPDKVMEKVFDAQYSVPVSFTKNMANHLVGLDFSLLKKYTNVILTRDPRDMLPSFNVQIDRPTLLDTAYQIQVEILDYLVAHGLPIVVVDSKKVLQNPRAMLSELCHRIDIPFDESMLSWKPGARKEDGVWAKYWYDSVHKSEGFAPYMAKEKRIPSALNKLLKECQPYYQRLASFGL
jgi:hypothetical protein